MPRRIVYAALGTPVPSGVTVLPLEEHPAIIEDMQAQIFETTEREKQTGRPKRIDDAELAQRIQEHLAAHSVGTAEAIAKEIGMGGHTPRVAATLGKSDLFRVAGVVQQGDKTKSLWALAETRGE